MQMLPSIPRLSSRALVGAGHTAPAPAAGTIQAPGAARSARSREVPWRAPPKQQAIRTQDARPTDYGRWRHLQLTPSAAPKLARLSALVSVAWLATRSSVRRVRQQRLVLDEPRHAIALGRHNRMLRHTGRRSGMSAVSRVGPIAVGHVGSNNRRAESGTGRRTRQRSPEGRALGVDASAQTGYEVCCVRRRE